MQYGRGYTPPLTQADKLPTLAPMGDHCPERAKYDSPGSEIGYPYNPNVNIPVPGVAFTLPPGCFVQSLEGKSQ